MKIHYLLFISIICLSACEKNPEEHQQQTQMPESSQDSDTAKDDTHLQQASDEKLSDTADTAYTGLSSAVIKGKCILFKKYAVELEQLEYNYNLQVFNAPDCVEDQLITTTQFEMDVSIAGEWHQYIVFDHGTSPNAHDISLFDPHTGEDKVILSYEGEPQFSSTHITYWKHEKDAEITDCSGQEKEFKEWKSFALGAILTQQHTFSLSSMTSKPIGKTKCFAQQ